MLNRSPTSRLNNADDQGIWYVPEYTYMIEYPVSKAAHALMHALRFSEGRGVVGSEVIVARLCCVG
jgi:hypothetical protein